MGDAVSIVMPDNARSGHTDEREQLRAEKRVFLFALGASLIVTGALVSLLCGLPPYLLRSWTRTIALALSYEVFAFGVHGAVVWVVCKWAREDTWSVRKLTLLSWCWIAWLPLLSLLTDERSIWVALLLPIMSAAVIVWLKHRSLAVRSDRRLLATELRSVFVQPTAAPFLLFLLPVLLTSLALQGGVGLLVARLDWLAGLALAAAVLLPAWRLTKSYSRRMDLQWQWWPVAMNSGLALLLMVLALVPFVPGAGLGLNIDMALERKQPEFSPVVHAHGRTSGSGDASIVLLINARPVPKKIVAPSMSMVPTATAEPVEIPFDGAYWYLKEQEDEPGNSAHVTHGDPLKAKIRSTNSLPVIMKAHQKLHEPIKLSCCSALKLDVTNADKRSGRILISVALQDSHTWWPVLLGAQVLPSSTHELTSPVHDSITFPLPKTKRDYKVDELTVKIQTVGERSLVGTQVAVNGFTLMR
jgi:hypothetical protein